MLSIPVNSENAVKPWYLYLIQTKQKKLYCGITTDIKRRFKEHCAQGKKTAKALRGQAPLSLVYTTQAGDRSSALSLEYKVKQMSRQQKLELIKQWQK